VTPLVESLLILGVVFIALGLGAWIGRVLPDHHITDASRTHITTAVAIVATLTALVLGLAINNANQMRVTMVNDLTLLSIGLSRVDGLLRRYGPAGDEARASLRQFAAQTSEDLFPQTPGKQPDLTNSQTVMTLERVQDQIVALQPHDDAQSWQRSLALSLWDGVVGTRWAITEQEFTKTPQGVVVILTFWLAILYCTYGLFMPRHLTSVMTTALSATAVASAMFLILEAHTPFSGLVAISSGSLFEAVRSLQR
jgi:hypothetical protein